MKVTNSGSEQEGNVTNEIPPPYVQNVTVPTAAHVGQEVHQTPIVHQGSNVQSSASTEIPPQGITAPSSPVTSHQEPSMNSAILGIPPAQTITEIR
ncbi:4906_t:CDS:1, partial [Acaulospora colombiana]